MFPIPFVYSWAGYAAGHPGPGFVPAESSLVSL
jgi:hypothetical protein